MSLPSLCYSTGRRPHRPGTQISTVIRIPSLPVARVPWKASDVPTTEGPIAMASKTLFNPRGATGSVPGRPTWSPEVAGASSFL